MQDRRIKAASQTAVCSTLAGLSSLDVNRSYFEDLHYGGKGINVSVMLTRLGISNKAFGFIAGYIKTGDYNYALKLGAACGNATAFSEALADFDEVQDVFERLNNTAL